MEFECSVCGYIGKDSKPPDKCPICKAPDTKFIVKGGNRISPIEYYMGSKSEDFEDNKKENNLEHSKAIVSNSYEMSTDKDSITPVLLSIRAGLSLISKQTDEVMKLEKEKRNDIERIREKENEISKFKNIIAENEKERLYIEKYELKRCSEEISKAKKYGNIYEYNRGYAKTIILISFIVGMIMCCFGSLGTFGVVISVMGVGLFILSIPIGLIIDNRIANQGLQEARDRECRIAEMKLDSYKQKLKNEDVEIEKNKKLIIQYEKEVADMQIKAAERAAILDEEITEITNKSKMIAIALNNTYGDFISEVDWVNIDLIIHYIETGRADTLKEALQQVDRQRQTNQIVSAIHAAQMAICDHIQSAFTRMGAALAESFSRLDARLQGISIQFSDSLNANKAANEALLGKLDKQLSLNEANKLLLEKSNRSSEELINDLRYNQRFWLK